MSRTAIVAALAGTLAALVVVGAFMALDRIELHWYSTEGKSVKAGSSPTSTPNNCALLQEQLAHAGTEFAAATILREIRKEDCPFALLPTALPLGIPFPTLPPAATATPDICAETFQHLLTHGSQNEIQGFLIEGCDAFLGTPQSVP
jgi:hypothetical protein